MKNIELEWFQKHMRIAALQCESKASPGKIISTWKQFNFNCEQLLHIGASGYFSFYDESRNEEAKRYIKEAHKKNIKIIFYVNVHAMPSRIAEAAPQLAARTKDGSLVPLYNRFFVSACISEPYRKWAFEKIANLAKNLDIDGLFLDGPGVPEQGCYCDTCRSYFRENYGYSPDNINVGAKQHRKNLDEYNFRLINEFMKGAQSTFKRIKPGALFYTNSWGLQSGKRVGRNNRLQLKYQDMLGAEGGFVYYDAPSSVPLWKSGATSKLLQSQAEGKPTVIFMAADHKPWNHYFLTPAETKLYYLDAIANGSSIWYGLHTDISNINNKSSFEIKRINSFLSKNEKYYSNTKSTADTALLFSLLNDENYRTTLSKTDFGNLSEQGRNNMLGNFKDSFDGYYEMMLHSQINFDVIDDDSLFEENLNRYKMLVLPNCGCVSKKMAQALSGYVKNGGNLLCQFDTSLFNEEGDPLGNFLASELMGVNYSGNMLNFYHSSYFSIVDRKNPVFRNLSQNMIPAPEYAVEVKPTTARVLARFHNSMPGQYLPLEGQLYPAVMENSYGKGKVYYLAGTFGELYKFYRIHDYRRITANLIDRHAGRKVIIKNNPTSLEVILRRKDEKTLLLHLINFSNDSARPVESIVPLHDVEITLKNLGKIKAARNIYGNSKIRKKSGDTFVIPLLDTYEVIVIELC